MEIKGQGLSGRWQARIIESLGVDFCLMLEFMREVEAVPAEEFIERILADQSRSRFLVCGNNFTFGAGSLTLASISDLFRVGVEASLRFPERSIPRQTNRPKIRSVRRRQ